MPKVAELREIEGAVWARIEMQLGSPIQLLSPDEIDVNQKREDGYLDEIERLRAALNTIAGICLGRDTGDLPAARVHKIAVDALNEQSTDRREG